MRKLFSLALACLLVVGLVGVTQAQEGNDYILSAELNEYGEIVVTLENQSGDDITVTDVEMAVSIAGTGLSWVKNILEEEVDAIPDDENPVVISTGGEHVIALLAPGLPDTWRPNDSSDHTLIFEAWVEIDGVVWHLDAFEVVMTPGLVEKGDLILGSISPTQHNPTESIYLTLTNNTGEDITISGDVVVQGTDYWSTEIGQHRFRVPLLGGESMDIPAGRTIQIAEVGAGAPGSWRNFWHPQILPLQAWVQIEDEGLWQSESITHVIAGEDVSDMFEGSASFKNDNEDGTATITVSNLQCGEYSTGVVKDGDEWIVNPGTFTPLGTATGLTKDHFQVLAWSGGGGEKLLGEVISAQETADGKYDIVWAYEDGDYNVFVQAIDGDTFGYLGVPDFAATISSTKPIESAVNPDSGKYEAALDFPVASISFSSETEIDADLNLRRKGSSLNPPPAGAAPAGLYMDINLDGELDDCEIILEVKYSLDDIPVGMNENNLRLFRFNEEIGEWEQLPDQEVDTEKKVIRVTMLGFSEFAVFEVGDELPQTGTSIYLLIFAGLFLIAGGIILRKQFA